MLSLSLALSLSLCLSLRPPFESENPKPYDISSSLHEAKQILISLLFCRERVIAECHHQVQFQRKGKRFVCLEINLTSSTPIKLPLIRVRFQFNLVSLPSEIFENSVFSLPSILAHARTKSSFTIPLFLEATWGIEGGDMTEMKESEQPMEEMSAGMDSDVALVI